MDPITLAATVGGGALLGGVGGYLSNESNKSALNKQLRYLKSLSPKLQAQYDDKIKQIEGTLAKTESEAGGTQSVTNYYDLLKNYNPAQFVYDPNKEAAFNYGKTEADFIDPGAQYRQNAAAKATQNSLAGQGNLFSGGAGRQLAAEAQDQASQEFGASNARLVADKDSAYKMYRDKVSDIKDKLGAQSQGYMQKIANASIPKNDIYTARSTASGQKLSALEQQQQNDLDLQNSLFGVQSSRDKIGGWQGALSSVIGGASGGSSAGSNIYSALKGK